MRTILTTLALALAGTAAALGQEGGVTDKDDSKSRVDISSARTGAFDRANDRLTHYVRFHAPISPRNFRNAVAENGPPGSVCINIWTTRTPWDGSPNYDVCASGNRARNRLVASVSAIGKRGSVRRVGRASAELLSARRLRVRFDPDLIRRPAGYRWSVHVTTFERGCTRRGCQDVAPKRGRSARMRIG